MAGTTFPAAAHHHPLASSKLYSVTKIHICKQVNQSFYITVAWQRVLACNAFIPALERVDSLSYFVKLLLN